MNSQEKIKEITNAMQDLLIYKNQKYGDSALKPNNVFFKGDATNSILICLDNKIGRIKSNTEVTPRTFFLRIDIIQHKSIQCPCLSS